MAKVVYTDKAFSDIDRIIEFNNNRNKSKVYSNKFLSNLRARLAKLAEYPLTGVKIEDPETRLLIWDNYYIFYEIGDGYIEIDSVYHQKENINR